MPCHANGMPVAGQPDPGRQVARVVLGRPYPVRGNFDRRQPEPFRTRRAVDIPVKPRMIRQNLKTAADQQDYEEKIHLVGHAQPGRKTVGLCRCAQRKTFRHR